MQKRLVTVVLASALVAGGSAWYHFHAASEPPRLTTAPATRQDVAQVVMCTGTLTPVTTVDVGSEESGTIKDLGVDFNSFVRKGEVLARLDTALFQSQLAQARANLAKATADTEASRVAVSDATIKLDRARALAARQLIPQSDLDDAAVALKEAQANLQLNQGQVAQAKGSVDSAEVNLTHAVIRSPIDGVVIDRKVDVGQTVAAGYQTPSLFSLAADLTKMQLQAVVDEADVGNVRAGETVRFRVDAYPQDEFSGVVTEVRLQPTIVQNVVSYTTIISVDNGELKLKPGMTATATIEIARHDDVVSIPSQALRFRPTRPVLGALGESSLEAKATGRVPLIFLPGSTAQVWVAQQGHIEPRTVRVGLSDGARTEITDGLQEGTLVTVAADLAPPPGRVVPTGSPLAPQPAWRWRRGF
jgi:HlyD family secretion protein